MENQAITFHSTPKIIHDLITVDKTRHPEKITSVITSCVLQYSMSLQEIEKTLRKYHCFTYLIAKKRDQSHETNSFMIPPAAEKTYYLWLTTRDWVDANREICQVWKNYEENFEKLADTGFRTDIFSIYLEKATTSPIRKKENLLKTDPIEIHWPSIASKKKSDVTIEGYELHKELLILISDSFKALYSEHWKFDDKHSLDFSALPLSSDPKTLFNMVCEWIYTGKLPYSHDDWLDIYILSDYLQINILKKQCETILISSINKSNAKDYLEYYHQSPIFQKLKEETIAFILFTYSNHELNDFLETIEDKTLEKEILLFERPQKSSLENMRVIYRGWEEIKKLPYDLCSLKVFSQDSEILLKKFREFDLEFFVKIYFGLKILYYSELDSFACAVNQEFEHYVGLGNIFSLKRKICNAIEIFYKSETVYSQINACYKIFCPFRDFLINKQKEAIQQYPYIFQELLDLKKYQKMIINDIYAKTKCKKEFLDMKSWNIQNREEIILLKQVLLNEKKSQEYYPLWDVHENIPVSLGSDMEIEVFGKGAKIRNFTVHQLICGGIFTEFVDPQTQKIKLYFSPDFFPKFLEFLYTGKIHNFSNINLDQINEFLIDATNILKGHPLHSYFIQYIDESICQLICEVKDQTPSLESSSSNSSDDEFIKLFDSNISYEVFNKMVQQYRLPKLQSFCLNQCIREILPEPVNSELIKNMLATFPYAEEIDLSYSADFRDIEVLAQFKCLKVLKVRSCFWVDNQILSTLSTFPLEEIDIAFTSTSNKGFILPLGRSFSSVRKLTMGISNFTRLNTLWKVSIDTLFQNFPHLYFLEFYVPYSIALAFEEIIYQTLCQCKKTPLTHLHLIFFDCPRKLDLKLTAFFEDENRYFETHPEFAFTYDRTHRRII